MTDKISMCGCGKPKFECDCPPPAMCDCGKPLLDCAPWFRCATKQLVDAPLPAPWFRASSSWPKEPLPPLKNPVHRKVYVIGRLANPHVATLANTLREALPGWEVFDDWQAAHAEADTEWRNYEIGRGRTYEQALRAPAAQNVFQFDKDHLDISTHGLLLLPAGRSGHLELGYLAGRGVSTAILLDGDYARWDVMYGFADIVTRDLKEVIDQWTA